MAKRRNENNAICARTADDSSFEITRTWAASGYTNLYRAADDERLRCPRPLPGLTVEPGVRDLKIDDFWSFVGAKGGQRWTWYGFDRQRRKIAASINDRRTDAACQGLLNKPDGRRIGRYHTDDWQSDTKFLPARKHKVGKEGHDASSATT